MNTTCAACAKQLEHDAPRCIRCKTKYLRQKIEVLKQALIKTKLHGELQARKAKDPTQDAPPPRTFARGWLDGPDSDDRWSSFQ